VGLLRHNEEWWYGVLTGVGDKLSLHLLYSPLSSSEQWSFTFYYMGRANKHIKARAPVKEVESRFVLNLKIFFDSI